jgi:hypothetical protein
VSQDLSERKRKWLNGGVAPPPAANVDDLARTKFGAGNRNDREAAFYGKTTAAQNVDDLRKAFMAAGGGGNSGDREYTFYGP